MVGKTKRRAPKQRTAGRICLQTLTAPLLRELIDHIDVYETEGTGKNRTQRICICYRFVGYLEVPVPDDVLLALDMRRGVRVNYTSKAV